MSKARQSFSLSPGERGSVNVNKFKPLPHSSNSRRLHAGIHRLHQNGFRQFFADAEPRIANLADEIRLVAQKFHDLFLAKTQFAKSIADLPEMDRNVIVLYHYEGLYLREIGDILGVTESRVSQILTRATARLRLKMREPAD